MTPQRSLARSLVLTCVAVVSLLGATPAEASPAAGPAPAATTDATPSSHLSTGFARGIPPVLYNRGEKIEPSRVHRTQTGRTGYASGLHWRGWGTDRAVGTGGVYFSDCRTCDVPTAQGTARVVLRHLRPCLAAGTKRYSTAVLVVTSARDDSTTRFRVAAGGCP